MVSIIAAIGKHRELGRGNKLLWHIPEDLKRFRQLTTGHSIIMGRKTFASIGRVLPGRTNIIVTQNKEFHVDAGVVVHSLEDAITQAMQGNSEEIFIIGGGQIYQQALPLADKLYLTIVHKGFDADTYFPDYARFSNIVYQRGSSDANYRYTFFELTPSG